MKAFGTFDIGCDNCDCAAFVARVGFIIVGTDIIFTDNSTADSGGEVVAVVISLQDGSGNVATGKISVAGGSVTIDITDLDQRTLQGQATVVTDELCSDVITWDDMAKQQNGLAAPVLALAAESDTEIGASWPAVDNADGYVLERSDDEDFTAPEVIYTGPLLAFIDTGLTANTFYWCRVKATNSGGFYQDSNWDSGTEKTDA